MPDKKLTDTEIIKALECCTNSDGCIYCPLYVPEQTGSCIKTVFANALDLINCQNAEIERLCGEIDELIIAKDLLFDEAEALIKKSKSEAIKEVANRLNKEAEKVCIDREGDFVEADGEIYDTVADWCKKTSDNIVKEMVGE